MFCVFESMRMSLRRKEIAVSHKETDGKDRKCLNGTRLNKGRERKSKRRK